MSAALKTVGVLWGAGRGGRVGGHWIRDLAREEPSPYTSVEQTEYSSTTGSSRQLQLVVR